jgi:hypothetical protein
MERDIGIVVVWVLFVIGWMAAIVWLLVEMLRTLRRVEAAVARVAYGAAPAPPPPPPPPDRKDPAAGIRPQEEAARRAEHRPPPRSRSS